MNDTDRPMSLEEAKRYFDEHKSELMQKAERSALNYLAAEKARVLAAETIKAQQTSAETQRSSV
ncbi:MAG: hypothetical protein QM790_10465 [Nibricoccus sp.]